MPTDAATVIKYLDFALLQLGAESYLHGINLQNEPLVVERWKYGFNDPTHPYILDLTDPNNPKGLAANKNDGQPSGADTPVLAAYNRMVASQAEDVFRRNEIIDHHANDSTGFSATLFKNKDTGAYTLSMRSTEYRPSEIAGDGERDLFGTSRQGIADKGFAFGQLASMEDYWSHISNGERWNNDTQAWVKPAKTPVAMKAIRWRTCWMGCAKR